MQQDIRQMMSPRFETINLTIQHMRNGRKRVPVIGMRVGKGPSNSCEAEAVSDLRIVINILIIVVINELVPKGLAKHDPDYAQKKNADDNCEGPLIRSAKWL